MNYQWVESLTNEYANIKNKNNAQDWVEVFFEVLMICDQITDGIQTDEVELPVHRLREIVYTSRLDHETMLQILTKSS